MDSKNREILNKIHDELVVSIARFLNIDNERNKEVRLLVSAEVEFYFVDKEYMFLPDGKKIDMIKGAIDKFENGGKWVGSKIEQVETEDGESQFEVQFVPSSNPAEIAEGILSLKKVLDRIVSFKAKPFKEQPGSGLHWHLSVYHNGENLFSKFAKYENNENLLLLSIAGMLANLNKYITVLCPTKECFDRVLFPKDTKYIMYPTNCSWGYNNRTCAIRIPEVPMEGLLGKNCRIEHRVCSSMADPLLALAYILKGMSRGINDKIQCPEPVYGNAFDVAYDYIEPIRKV